MGLPNFLAGNIRSFEFLIDYGMQWDGYREDVMCSSMWPRWTYATFPGGSRIWKTPPTPCKHTCLWKNRNIFLASAHSSLAPTPAAISSTLSRPLGWIRDHLGSLWCYFGIDLRSPWSHSGITPGSLCGTLKHSRSLLQSEDSQACRMQMLNFQSPCTSSSPPIPCQIKNPITKL